MGLNGVQMEPFLYSIKSYSNHCQTLVPTSIQNNYHSQLKRNNVKTQSQNNKISQRSVALLSRCSGIFNNHLIANCPQSAPV